MLTLLHTASSNVAVFDELLKGIAPGLPVRHVVDEAILRQARDAGTITPELVERVDASVRSAIDRAELVLCTCSTVGGLAEAAGSRAGARVLRVDRPMAVRAVSIGPRIGIAATLKSTLEPTAALVHQVAQETGRPVEVTALFIGSAWPIMERGDPGGYAREIATHLEATCANTVYDAIVLAQASMAIAEPLCNGLPCPVLSSPRLGLEAALRELGRQC
jgi:hypothetical protein